MDIQEIYQQQKTSEINKGEQRAIGKGEQRAIGDFGMTASATKESSEIGARILRDGGNAVDAIVARCSLLYL